MKTDGVASLVFMIRHWHAKSSVKNWESVQLANSECRPDEDVNTEDLVIPCSSQGKTHHRVAGGIQSGHH